MTKRQRHPERGYTDYSIGETGISVSSDSLNNLISSGMASLKSASTEIIDAAKTSALASLFETQGTGTYIDSNGSLITSGIDISEGKKIVEKAMSYIGIPYHWAGTGPGACSGITTHGLPADGYKHSCCFDCSGLVVYCYKTAAGITLNRNSSDQWTQTKKKKIVLGSTHSVEDLIDLPMPGDLVFFHNGERVHHVGICVGEGSCQFIEAPSTGKRVRVSKLTSRKVYGITRMLDEVTVTGNTQFSSSIYDSMVMKDSNNKWDKDSLKNMVKTMAQREFGWTGAQWTALDWLISKESSWNPAAQNPTSTAYGLFQFLDKTWAGTGGTKTSDPVLQSFYGLKYIKNRYKTPAGAKAHWESNHWY
jgi:cell wall-associated NlpC family hydrolase